MPLKLDYTGELNADGQAEGHGVAFSGFVRYEGTFHMNKFHGICKVFSQL